jgi:uncharacterized protein DUF6968
MIAERLLNLKEGGRTVEVPVRILAPEREKQAWSCRYEILWPDGTRIATARGIDSAQAILVALQMIGAELYTSDHHKAGRLMFDEPGRGYGFPLVQNLRDLLIGDDAKYL